MNPLSVYAIVLIVVLMAWFWAANDVMNSDFINGNTKLIWTLIIIFAPFFGSILYFLIGRKQKLTRI